MQSFVVRAVCVAFISLILMCGTTGCTSSPTSSGSTTSSGVTTADTARCWRFWGYLGPQVPTKQQLEAAARLISDAHDPALQAEGRSMLMALLENKGDYYQLELKVLSTCRVTVPPPT